jgi:hypothetical protein
VGVGGWVSAATLGQEGLAGTDASSAARAGGQRPRAESLLLRKPAVGDMLPHMLPHERFRRPAGFPNYSSPQRDLTRAAQGEHLSVGLAGLGVVALAHDLGTEGGETGQGEQGSTHAHPHSSQH